MADDEMKTIVLRPDQLQQGEIYYEDSAFNDAKRVYVEVGVPGRRLVRMQAREPGILAVVSRPDQDGIQLVSIEVGGIRYHDTTNGIVPTKPAERWALEALGVLPKTKV